ncbi:MAG TPA: hypothetical protein VH643_31265 [Gemmataceae bacterium]|jgi:hypothetical protein
MAVAHARILLKADAADGGPAWTDHKIAQRDDLSPWFFSARTLLPEPLT